MGKHTGNPSFVEYNTVTNTTRTLADMPHWRKSAASVTVANGTGVLVCGGIFDHVTTLSACTLYTVASSQWTIAFPSLPTPLSAFTMISIAVDRPFVCAGHNGTAFVNTR
jgi:hypothetical protein